MDAENTVKEIFFDVFANLNEDNFDWNAKQEDYLNWDSFAHLELMTGAEEKFNIKILPEEALSIRTAKELLEFVKSRI